MPLRESDLACQICLQEARRVGETKSFDDRQVTGLGIGALRDRLTERMEFRQGPLCGQRGQAVG
jgi:hypothetical protein